MLAPEGGNGGRPDLHVSTGGHREVDPEERLAEIRHGVDVGPERSAAAVAVQVQPLEREQAVPLAETVVPGNPVSVEPCGVNHVAGGELSSRCAHAARLGATVG